MDETELVPPGVRGGGMNSFGRNRRLLLRRETAE